MPPTTYAIRKVYIMFDINDAQIPNELRQCQRRNDNSLGTVLTSLSGRNDEQPNCKNAVGSGILLEISTSALSASFCYKNGIRVCSVNIITTGVSIEQHLRQYRINRL